MRKQVFIINGQGGVGKDTICNCAAQYFRVRNVSSITPIVEIARFAGWDGQKTLAARRLLSQLKQAFTEFNDLSFTYCLKAYQDFLDSDDEILFLHVSRKKLNDSKLPLARIAARCSYAAPIYLHGITAIARMMRSNPIPMISILIIIPRSILSRNASEIFLKNFEFSC